MTGQSLASAEMDLTQFPHPNFNEYLVYER